MTTAIAHRISDTPIQGVRTKALEIHPDDRGRVMEVLRADDEIYERFGQVYITTALPGVVKGWHCHRKQTDHFACVQGMIKLVLYDARENSATQGAVNEFFMGEHNPLLVKIPPLVYHGFQCISTAEAVVVNVPTEPYNRQQPDEIRVAADSDTIPYDWSRRDR